MLKSARRESRTPFQEMLTIPGGTTFAAPPPLEQRLYYVSDEADAYTPVDGRRRSVTEVAHACLPCDELLVHPDSGEQNIFRLRRELGRIIVENTVYPKSLVSQLYEADDTDPDMLARQLRSVEIARELNDTLRVLPENGLRVLAKEVAAMINSDFMTRSRLHQRAGDDIRSFKNTGYETYVLPKDLEASVRIVPIGAATAWFRAFRNWPEFYERGFDYMPIEPVLDIAPTDDPACAAVMTTNLRGIPFQTVIPLIPQYKSQLYEMSEQILSGLSDMRIAYKDVHGSNFIVVPYTQASGRPDLSRCPRLFLIDFEDAEIIR